MRKEGRRGEEKKPRGKGREEEGWDGGGVFKGEGGRVGGVGVGWVGVVGW